MAYFRTWTSDYSSLQYNNLTPGNIKKGVTVTVKDPNNTTLKTVTGTYVTSPVLIGTYSGDRTINVSSYKRSSDTVNNFIIEYSSMYEEANNNRPCQDTDNYTTASSSLSKSLSGNNLIISGATVTTGNPDFVWGRCTLTYKVYHI